MATIKSQSMISGLVIRKAKWKDDVAPQVINLDVDLSTGQVSQITLTVDDPGFEILGKSKLPLGASVDYEKQKMAIADIDVGEGGGAGGFSVVARPRVVRKLKRRKGKLVLRSVSPSQFVKQETKAAGGEAVVQPSARRQTIARDVPQSGSEGTDENSSWTTFQRLAGELGFIVFEAAGVVYFGKPSWLVKRSKKVHVYWSTDFKKHRATHATTIPQCSRSLDDDGKATITVTVPYERAGEFIPGGALVLHGIPTFNSTYMITSVKYQVDGYSDVTVNAETPTDPDVPEKEKKEKK